MKTINRTAITIIPKKPYIDWANSIDDDGPKIELESINATSLLIPIKYDEFNYEQFLKKKYKIIFEEELAAWIGDPNLWPKNRDYKKFKKWFEIIPSDALFVFGDDPIVLEEY
jgi:hypothetical protein